MDATTGSGRSSDRGNGLLLLASMAACGFPPLGLAAFVQANLALAARMRGDEIEAELRERACRRCSFPAIGIGIAFLAGWLVWTSPSWQEGLEPVVRVALVVVSIVVLGIPLVRGGNQEYSLEEDLQEDHEVAALGRERAVVLESLRDLRDEHGAGKINDEDYEDLRQRYEAEAAGILRRLDELRAVEEAEIERAVKANRTMKAGGKKR